MPRAWRAVLAPVLTLALLSTLLACAAGRTDAAGGPTTPSAAEDQPAPNAALAWNAEALEAVRDAKPGPPMVARALYLLSAAAYDAWTAYDPTARTAEAGDLPKRPAPEATAAAKAEAVSYAAHRVLADLFPGRKAALDARMRSLGYDPADVCADPATPRGLGDLVARRILAARHHDGSNQLGDLAPGPYADYTGYRPRNPAIRLDVPTPRALIPDPDHWQPLTWDDPLTHRPVTPGFLGAQWYRVKPFALCGPEQFTIPRAPSRAGTAAFEAQAEEILALSAGLTDEQKAIAEYWKDGPHSETPPGHWNLFAEAVSLRDRHTLDQDVRMFLALNGALHDAAISAWACKRTYDLSRPVTALRWLYAGRTVRAWAGPGLGVREIPGEAWIPYQPASFPTPPFPECVSGHSTFSAAAAEVLKRFTGSDAFEATWTLPAGRSQTEPGTVPARDVTLAWSSFSGMADQAGLSRRYGGIHFRDGDLWGRAMGRQVGAQAFRKAQALWGCAP